MMEMKLCLISFTVLIAQYCVSVKACSHYHDPKCIVNEPLKTSHFLNQFIVEIHGGEEKSRQIAHELGFEFWRPMKNHRDVYIFRHHEIPKRHKKKHPELLKKLRGHKDIVKSDQHYAFQLTLNELDEFTDMVGLDEPEGEDSFSILHQNGENHSRNGEVTEEDFLLNKFDFHREVRFKQRNYPEIHADLDIDWEKLYEEKRMERIASQKATLQNSDLNGESSSSTSSSNDGNLFDDDDNSEYVTTPDEEY